MQISSLSIAQYRLYPKYLTRSATEKLVHSLISSRLDFGNGLLYNLPNSQIGQLQKLQNAAARVVSLSSKRSHITPILKTLHWLPVKERIIFKILLFVYYIVNGTAPDYNKSLLRLYQPTRTLRSSNSGLFANSAFQEILGGTCFCSCRTICKILYISIPFVKFMIS